MNIDPRIVSVATSSLFAGIAIANRYYKKEMLLRKDAINALREANRYYTAKLDEHEVPMTEFDRIAVHSIFDE